MQTFLNFNTFVPNDYTTLIFYCWKAIFNENQYDVKIEFACYDL